MAWLRYFPVTFDVTPGRRDRRTETGSVMIDVLSMRIQWACRGINSRLSADENGRMPA
jgi:hypothetical protein